MRTLFFIFILTCPSVAMAQNKQAKEKDREVTYRERTEIDFEGVDVQGQLVKPQGRLVLSRRDASFNPLIRLRENFDAEMKDSIDEIK
jgi:hypothetical protein